MDASSLRFVYAAFATTWVVLAAYTLYVHIAVKHARAAYDRAHSSAAETR
ncbi:MAG: hypothetical protein IT357_16325 [Gemmatimonadaceae bacterium]|nr:hypothetical protein [Gemmatimonadaceae bacterium]